MTRYRAKPIRFWFAHFLVGPLAGAIVSLAYMFLVLNAFQPVGDFFEMAGLTGIVLFAAFLYAYFFGFCVTLAYTIALGLLQRWRRGHTIIEAVLIGWLALAITWGIFVLMGQNPTLIQWFLYGGLVVIPLLWFVCLWSGITYRIRPEPVLEPAT